MADGLGILEALQKRAAQAVLDKGAPAALGYMDDDRRVAGLTPAEHLVGEVAGLGELPVGSPEAAGFAGYASLPSAVPSYELARGDLGAIPGVLFYTTIRAALLGIGMYAAGMREKKDLVKYSLAGSATIQAWILWWAITRRPAGR